MPPKRSSSPRSSTGSRREGSRAPEGRPDALATALAWILGAVWAVGPLLPAALQGKIPGAPYTDLYPSVWGLGWFAGQQPGLPAFTAALAAPAGMPFYYSSPLHGWVGTPLVALGGAALAYTVTLALARWAGIVVAFAALRALGLGGWGALAGALVYGASPFLHGYAVEGIVEGTDGWALPLWVWAVARRRWLAGALAFGALVYASWYLAMVGCLLAAGWGLRTRVAWASAALGLVVAAPGLWAFLGAAQGASPLPDDVRAAMGTVLAARPPWWSDGGSLFAIGTWTGGSALLLAAVGLRRHPGWALAALACAVLALGRGPWYDLPVLESVRFPYRWHAGVLWGLAVLAGAGVDALGRRWLALVPLVEALALAPTPIVLPGANAEVPPLYDRVTGPILLEVPGPVALPPGEINLSRPRARYLLYYQLHHGAASPWAPDFNGIGATPPAPWLAAVAAWDPVVRAHAAPDAPPPGAFPMAEARAAGVRQVMVHRDELKGAADGFEAALTESGAQLVGEAGRLALYDLP